MDADIGALALIIAFGPASVMALKSLHNIETKVGQIYRKGCKGHLDLGSEDGRDGGNDDGGDPDTSA